MPLTMTQRGLVRLTCAAEIDDWRERFAGGRVWWYGLDPPDGVHLIPPARARGELGGECDLLVFDARQGFDADAFGALSGAVVGGGVLVLLAPPKPRGRFAARLERVLQRAPCEVEAARSRLVALPSGADPAAATADQARAVAALLRVALGHRRRPLVLSADRGRGKSAALGIAAVRLLEAGREAILVTAPRAGAAASLFDQVERLLGTRHSAGLAFVAPDELARHPRAADLLLVDEAAGLPVALLERLLSAHARIAFATTVHGYEGTGRGFALRFREVLERRTPGWRELRLEAPIRWAAGDPLERFTFDALLLDAAPAPAEAVAHATPDSCTIARLDRDALGADEVMLRELFGLLVLAHYQTRPSDLQRLLDDPMLSVWAARHAGHVVATALIAREGGFARDLAEAVAAGRRRPRGHLLPQALALHQGIPEAARLTYGRVMRIAVHPAAQRRGLGSALLETLASDLAEIDFLGTSFGATPELLAFWRRAGLLPVRLGVHRDAASGTHSAMLLRPLTPAAGGLFERLHERFLDELPYLLCDGYDDLEWKLVAALAAGAPGPACAATDRGDLLAYAAGERDYAGALAALWRISWQTLAAGALESVAPGSREALVRRVLQKQPWTRVAEELGVPGRAQVEALLRAAAATLSDGSGAS